MKVSRLATLRAAARSEVHEASASLAKSAPFHEALGRSRMAVPSALFGLIVACAPSPRTIQSPNDSTKDAISTPKTNREDNSSQNSLPMPQGTMVSFHRELERISKIRKLPVQGKTTGLLLERSELIAHVERAVTLETPQHALLGTEHMLVGLGLAPSDFNFREAMLSMLSENLQGLYDPHLKTMMVRADLTENRLATLRHELVHALQDQNYDLNEVVEWNPDDTDRSSALSCLAEGDATSAMFDAMLPANQTALDLPQGFIQQQFDNDDEKKDRSRATPGVVRRSLVAPYKDGIEFVHALRKRGGWEEVNRVWKNPPSTTEQVLHLEKYDAQEEAIVVPIPQPPSNGWELVLSDIWGEQSLRLVLEEWTSVDIARSAAAGWGGDRIAAYRRADELAVAWALQMDSKNDAKELFDALELRPTSQRGKTNASPSKEASSASCRRGGENGGGALAISRSGAVVFLTSGFLKRAGGSEGNCSQAQGWNETLRAKSK